MSSNVRPTSSGCSWVWANQPGRTRAPRRARPWWATGAMTRSSTGRWSGSGSLPPAARSRRKCDLPEPLGPSTATRSPYQISTSNGAVRSVSSSASQTTARLPVRPPASRRSLPGAPPAQPHLHVLLQGQRLWWPRLLEALQPGAGGLVGPGHTVVVGGLLPQPQHERLELVVLFVPAPAQLLQPLEPCPPGLVVGGEATAVHPDAVPCRTELDGHHGRRCSG